MGISDGWAGRPAAAEEAVGSWVGLAGSAQGAWGGVLVAGRRPDTSFLAAVRYQGNASSLSPALWAHMHIF